MLFIKIKNWKNYIKRNNDGIHTFRREIIRDRC